MKPVENLTLEEIDQKITRTAVEAAIEIGYYLKQIRDRKLYEQAGCRDVYEYAQKQYGYDKSVASRHMSRNDRFSIGGDSPWLNPKYLGYGKNQLQEMVSMTDEQLEQVTPDMTVREMRELKKKPEKDEKPGPVATSQQNRKDGCPPGITECIRQEWGTSAEQQEQGRKECAKCWNHWERLQGKEQPKPEENPPVSPGASPEKEQKFSVYGLPTLKYPPDSLITGPGCGEYGGILYDCFSCHMNNCQIRQKDCYCAGAPMGNPFPCKTLLLMEQKQIRQELADHPCQFLNHDLAYHRAGDKAAVPCCKNCNTHCGYQCDRVVRKEEQQEEASESDIVDGEFREVDDSPKDDRYEEISDLTDMELMRKELDRSHDTLKLMRDAFKENDWRIRKQKMLIGALAAYISELEELQDGKEEVQPELPVLRNNDQRKAWLRNYKDWGLWYKDNNIGAEYYKYDFENGARLIAEVYQEPKTKYVSAYES